MFAKAFLLLAGVAAASAFSCASPKYSHTGYSTSDGFFHYETSYIVEFTLQCDAPIRDASFHAVINNKVYTVAHSEETNKFQVSWQLPHSESGSQTFEIGIYDDETFKAVQKAVNNDELPSSVAPTFTISQDHSGVSTNRFLYIESVITIISLFFVYAASVYRSELKA
uniref:Translocon-associated protein subunit delta n=1 Tax=Panagrellus redivivus TaxID=6233 RepID=A0A7E4VVE8_PANRE